MDDERANLIFITSGPYRVKTDSDLATESYWKSCEAEIIECIETCGLSHEEAYRYVETVLCEIEAECRFRLKPLPYMARMVSAEIIVSRVLYKTHPLFKTVDIAHLLRIIYLNNTKNP